MSRHQFSMGTRGNPDEIQPRQTEKVDLRDVWPHEALDFTKWLSEEPNLAILSSAVGIELELIETESSVGLFNVDIVPTADGTRLSLNPKAPHAPKAAMAIELWAEKRAQLENGEIDADEYED